MKDKHISHMVDKALKSPPSFKLEKGFKDRVLKRIEKMERASQTKLYLWMALGMIAIFGMSYAIMSYFIPSLLLSIASFSIAKPFLLVLLACLFFIAIQYLDQRLVKDKYMVLR